MSEQRRQWIADGGDDRMAKLASRITDPDECERRYASTWLDKLWRLRDAVFADTPHG